MKKEKRGGEILRSREPGEGGIQHFLSQPLLHSRSVSKATTETAMGIRKTDRERREKERATERDFTPAHMAMKQNDRKDTKLVFSKPPQTHIICFLIRLQQICFKIMLMVWIY